MMSNNQMSLYDGGGDGMDLLRRRLFQMPPGGYNGQDPMMMQQRPVMMGQPIAQPDMQQQPGQMPVGNWDQTKKNWTGAGANVSKIAGLAGA
jgi:hypothetical protein